jgi:hypothetical protein
MIFLAFWQTASNNFTGILANCLKMIFLAFWQTTFKQNGWHFGKLPPM